MRGPRATRRARRGTVRAGAARKSRPRTRDAHALVLDSHHPQAVAGRLQVDYRITQVVKRRALRNGSAAHGRGIRAAACYTHRHGSPIQHGRDRAPGWLPPSGRCCVRGSESAGPHVRGHSPFRDGLVFATALGRPLGPTNISRDFRRLRDLAPYPGCKRPTAPTKAGGTEYRCRCGQSRNGGGLPQLPFHALRHTAASVQLAAGVPLEIVSKRIGHRKLSTTADIYGHRLP